MGGFGGTGFLRRHVAHLRPAGQGVRAGQGERSVGPDGKSRPQAPALLKWRLLGLPVAAGRNLIAVLPQSGLVTDETSSMRRSTASTTASGNTVSRANGPGASRAPRRKTGRLHLTVLNSLTMYQMPAAPSRREGTCPRRLSSRSPQRQQVNSGGLLPKTGSLQPEWRRCGKPRCRCATGPLHGPYWYLRWREGGRQCRQYVPREQVNAMRAAIAQRKRGSSLSGLWSSSPMVCIHQPQEGGSCTISRSLSSRK